MTSQLGPIFQILGIGVATHFGGIILENMGQGGKVLYVKVAAYALCAWITFETWWGYMEKIAMIFGVSV